jgi:hypothetical protein
MPRLRPPDDGVTVRMYRQGHGDCFLLALPREGGGDPVYVLVDCGYKPGSPAYLGGTRIDDVVKHIGEATRWRLDLAVVTHEHQDHVNGFWRERSNPFARFRIDEAWMAWTEDPADELASELRRRHRDALLGLIGARHKLADAVDDQDPVLHRVDALLGVELGGEGESPRLADLAAAGERLAAGDAARSVNKQAMKLVRDKARAGRGVRYLVPGERPRVVPGSAGVRAYVLGPPRDERLLRDEDPVGDEAFPRGSQARGLSFHAAVSPAGRSGAPFGGRHCVPMERALEDPGSFFVRHYGREGDGVDDRDGVEVPPDAAWRRIGDEWLRSAEALALALNTGVNNTSLVLAFELPRTRKVLLFVGDAQRGSWVSWPRCEWRENGAAVTARDLLGRTVLYKVGHHGSHNATLDGRADDPHPNLAWMARGEYAGEFTAMITAVSQWAADDNDPPWHHPLPSIRRALLEKAQGRVFQTDVARPEKPVGVPDEAWRDFMARADFQELYFDWTIRDR